MRALGISVISLVLTAGVICNAYFQKKQFYPSVVYITKSNPSMAVIYIQAFILVLLIGKLMRKIFFGQLRAAEFEHLIERSWYAVTETCLAFTVFRDDFNPKFVALFTVLLFLKSFHWLAEDRVDYMERSPVISWIFHVRVLGLLALLGALDIHFLSLAYNSTVTKGASVQLVFGFEYAILLTMVANTAIKYCLHSADLRSESPWDGKAVLLLYSELAVGCLRVLLYIAFVAIMVRIYTLPLFAFRPMYYTMRNFKKAFNDVILSRRAIRNMNTLYADATPQELAEVDNVCIICRDIMTTNAKKLPCNHIFHTSCLRSWFQRQQTCPTCRLDILRPVAPTVNPQAQAGAVPAAAQAGAGAGAVPGRVPQAVPGQGDAANTPHANIQAQGPNANLGVGNPFPQFVPPVGFPPFPFPMPGLGMVPPPPVPPEHIATLTEEELRALEGTERSNVEARIKYLRNIQLMLDVSMTLMQHYQMVSLRHPNVPTTIPTSAAPTPPTPSSTPTNITTTTSSSVTAPANAEKTEQDNIVPPMEEPVSVAAKEHSAKTNNLDLNQPSTSRTVFDSELQETDNKLTEEEKLLSTMITSETDELRRRRIKRFENLTE